MTKLTLWRPD